MPSPLSTSKDDLIQLVHVVAQRVEYLVARTIGRKLPITCVTIFSHHPDDYERFVAWAREMGTQSEANNGVQFALREPIQTASGMVARIRIRKPDPYSSQLGCADVLVDDYDSFKNAELSMHPTNLRLIKRTEYEMLEFFDFDSNDVLAYVVSKSAKSF